MLPAVKDVVAGLARIFRGVTCTRVRAAKPIVGPHSAASGGMAASWDHLRPATAPRLTANLSGRQLLRARPGGRPGSFPHGALALPAR